MTTVHIRAAAHRQATDFLKAFIGLLDDTTCPAERSVVYRSVLNERSSPEVKPGSLWGPSVLDLQCAHASVIGRADERLYAMGLSGELPSDQSDSLLSSPARKRS